MAGNLEFKSINGNLFGGQIKGVAVMTSGQENQLSSKFNLTNILLSEAFLATFGKNLAEGKLDVDLDLTNSNITSTRFMSLFQGAAQLQIKKLKIAAKNKNPIFQGLHLLSTFVNPSTKKVKELTSNITGSFNIKQGIAQTQDLILISDLGVAPVYGHINVPLWQIDMAGTLKPEKTKLSKLLKNSMQKKELSIPFTFKGSLNSPLFKFDPSSLLRAKVTKNVLGDFVGKNQKTVGRLLEGFLKGSNPADRKTDRNFNDKSIIIDPSKLLKNLLK